MNNRVVMKISHFQVHGWILYTDAALQCAGVLIFLTAMNTLISFRFIKRSAKMTTLETESYGKLYGTVIFSFGRTDLKIN